MLEIREVKTRKEKKIFATYPQKLFRGCENYIPSFVSDELAFFDPSNPNRVHCDARGWLAYRDGEVVGRIGGIVQHQYNEMSGRKCIRFSRFECENDQDVANALLDSVAAWGRELGMDTMHGPWDFNDQGREGMMTQGFDTKCSYITNYNYAYFPELIANYGGFEDECEWVEYRFDVMPDDGNKVMKVADHVANRLKIRDVSQEMPKKKLIKQYGHEIFDLLNVAYKDLNCYVPVEGETVDGLLDQFGTIVNMRYLSLIMDENDRIIGFAVALPSIADAVRDSHGRLFPFGWIRILNAICRPKTLEWALIGVVPEYQGRGVNAVLLANIVRRIAEDGLQYLDSDPMLVTNTSVLGQLDSLHKTERRRRKCFVKSIAAECAQIDEEAAAADAE